MSGNALDTLVSWLPPVGATSVAPEIRDALARVEVVIEAARAGENYLKKLSDPLCPPVIRQVALDHFAELNAAALRGLDEGEAR